MGRKVVRTNLRRFLPNLQQVRAIVGGKVQRILVCVSCIKRGRVTRPTPAAKAA